MKERIIFQDLRDEGIEIGREDERVELITNMLRRGKTVEEIVDFCNYPYDEVKRVEESLLTKV